MSLFPTKTVQINVWWTHGGVIASANFAEFLIKKMQTLIDSGFEAGPISTHGERTEWRFKTSSPAQCMLVLDTEILQGNFSKYDPESFKVHDPFSVRYQVMPSGLVNASLIADVVNYQSEKQSMLLSELLSTQSKVMHLEQMMQQVQHVNLHNHGLKHLPDIVKHVNEQLSSIGCQPYVIPQITKN